MRWLDGQYKLSQPEAPASPGSRMARGSSLLVVVLDGQSPGAGRCETKALTMGERLALPPPRLG